MYPRKPETQGHINLFDKLQYNSPYEQTKGKNNMILRYRKSVRKCHIYLKN